MLDEYKLDVLVLTEVDMVNLSDKYTFEAYKSFCALPNPDTAKVRVMVLVKNYLHESVKVRSDLMSSEFQSVWLELSLTSKSWLISGVY